MSLLRRSRRSMTLFESRTEQWRQVGLGAEVDRGSAQRARGSLLVIAALIAGVLVLFSRRQALFPGLGTPVRVITVIALLALGWALARQIGRGIVTPLFRRLDPATAGTVGFLVRLITVLVVTVVALRIAGLSPSTLAVGGAFTAVIVGLAAQQTLGNLIAGFVLLSTRPFRVGERIRLVGGPVAGSIEGIASSLGLFYVTLVNGADRIMVPNSILLELSVVPLREPERVELRARFPASVTPNEVQARLTEGVSVALRYPPHVALEELDHDEVVVRIIATPQRPADGGQLATEVLTAIRSDGGATTAHPVAAGARG